MNESKKRRIKKNKNKHAIFCTITTTTTTIITATTTTTTTTTARTTVLLFQDCFALQYEVKSKLDTNKTRVCSVSSPLLGANRLSLSESLERVLDDRGY